MRIITSALALAATLAAAALTPDWADVDYVGDGHIGHKCDIYMPPGANGPVHPIIVIYGSSWLNDDGKIGGANESAPALLEQGFAVVAINHRSIREVPFPAQIHDTKAAIRFVRANAERYGFDTSFVGMVGHSSGSHLASLAGTTNGLRTARIGNDVYDLEGDLGPYCHCSSQVDAVCEWFGPVDFPLFRKHMNQDRVETVELLVGGKLDDSTHKIYMLSPTIYLGKGAPDATFMLIHGDADDIVPIDQSEVFAEKLREHGKLYDFIAIKDGRHGDITITPATNDAMGQFFKRITAK